MFYKYAGNTIEKNWVKFTDFHFIIDSSTLQDSIVKRARYINPQVLALKHVIKKE